MVSWLRTYSPVLCSLSHFGSRSVGSRTDGSKSPPLKCDVGHRRFYFFFLLEEFGGDLESATPKQQSAAASPAPAATVGDDDDGDG